VRDYGLLEAAVARPRATVFGKDAYPDLDSKAAALLHPVARNRALIDGNKRLALTAVIALFRFNVQAVGWPLTRLPGRRSRPPGGRATG
jgi:death on curing protein